MATADGFRLEQRTLLGDLDLTTYSDQQLDTWRDEEVGILWSLGLFKRGTNRASEPTIRKDDQVEITRYYALPTNFRRVTEIEFIDGGHIGPPAITLATATTGGSLSAGLFAYRISVTDSVGETVPGGAYRIVVPSGTSTNTVTLTWATVTVAAVPWAVTTGYKIYILTNGAYVLLTTISSNATATYLHTTGAGSGAAPTTDTSASPTDSVSGRSTGFDDLEEQSSNVRVEEAPAYENFKVRMFGEKEYTAVSDTAVKQEVLDVILYGSVLRGLTSELVSRAQSSRSIVATRNLDSTAGTISLSINTIRAIYKGKVAKALAVQARSTLVR